MFGKSKKTPLSQALCGLCSDSFKGPSAEVRAWMDTHVATRHPEGFELKLAAAIRSAKLDSGLGIGMWESQQIARSLITRGYGWIGSDVKEPAS